MELMQNKRRSWKWLSLREPKARGNLIFLGLLVSLFLGFHISCLYADWVIQTIDSAGAVGWNTSIALDTNNYPHISYYDYTNGDLKYAKWTGSSWSIQTVDSAGYVGDHTSIALDTNNYPHISYRDNTNYDLKYAKWTNNPVLSWAGENVNYVSDGLDPEAGGT